MSEPKTIFRNVYVYNDGTIFDGGMNFFSESGADKIANERCHVSVMAITTDGGRVVGVRHIRRLGAKRAMENARHPEPAAFAGASGPSDSPKDPTEGLEFVVWVPSSNKPVTTKYKTRAQAQSCAHRLAEKEGVEAYVCALTDVVNPPPKAKSERKALL